MENQKEKLDDNNKSKDQNHNNQSVIIIVVVIVVAAILLALVFKTLSGSFGKSLNLTDLDKMLTDKETKIIYVENSDSKKCSKCSKVKKHLDSKKIKYSVYDVNKVKDTEYQEFLQKLLIDSEVFNYPAVIYIRDGAMYSNIINIDDTAVVDQFISDYDLTKVEK